MKRVTTVVAIWVLIAATCLTGGCSREATVDSMQAAVDIAQSYYANAVQDEGLEFYRGVYVFYDMNDIKKSTPHYNMIFTKPLSDSIMVDMLQLNPETSEVTSVDTSYVALDAMPGTSMALDAYDCPIAAVLDMVKEQTGTDWAKMAFKINMPLLLGPDVTNPKCWELSTVASNGDSIAITVDLQAQTTTPVTPTPAPTTDPDAVNDPAASKPDYTPAP